MQSSQILISEFYFKKLSLTVDVQIFPIRSFMILRIQDLAFSLKVQRQPIG